MRFRRNKTKVDRTGWHPQSWSPGAWKRFPRLAFAEMIGSLASLVVCCVILILSDGQPVSSWSIQPSVYIAIAVPVINLLLADALSQGLDIAWWLGASKTGASVGDLHRLWSFGRSFKDAIMAGKRMNFMALACILATLAQVNNPLFQRASKTIEQVHVSQTSVTLSAAADMPWQYKTGMVSGRNLAPSLFTPEYSAVVSDFYTSKSIKLSNNHGCAGTCKTRMKAMGLSVNCSVYSMPFDLRPRVTDQGSWNGSSDPASNGTEVFYTQVRWSAVSASTFSIKTLFKDSYACAGSLNGQSCTILTGTVDYGVVIDGPQNTISIDPSTTIWDDVVVNTSSINGNSTLEPGNFAGFILALSNKYASRAYLNWGGAADFVLSTSGALATQYALQNISTDAEAGDESLKCRPAFGNPMEEVLAGARELMFRTSLAIAQYNSSLAVVQQMSADQVENRAVFHSEYVYLACAVSVTMIAMVVITLVFRGYSELGRPVTLSPVELAKAFDAPLLKGRDGNAPVDALIDELGTKSIRYGAVRKRYAGKQDPKSLVEVQIKENTPDADVEEVGTTDELMKLYMADEQLVTQPKAGQVFTG